MARSRKSAEALLSEALAASLDDRSAPSAAHPLAIAWSGGLDSTVLLHAALARWGAASVRALHVHHGLQPAADDWVTHCENEAARLDVSLQVLRARGQPAPAESVEAWARSVRYRLLRDAARSLGACALLTAHHADDQIETLLLAMARGCGLAGLTGIAAQNTRHGVRLVRPFLPLSRDALQAEAQARGLVWIEDPSNQDSTYPRNAVRAQVLPALRVALPGLGAQMQDTLSALAEARALIESVAEADLAQTRAARSDPGPMPPGTLDRRAVARLSPPRRTAVWRAWLAGQGEPPPSRAKLAEIEAQLLHAQSASAALEHGDCQLRRWRDWIWAEPRAAAISAPVRAMLLWQGETRLPLPDGSALCVTQQAEGLDPQWLRGQRLEIAPAPASARVRLQPGAARRTLKNLRQEWRIPEALRDAFPGVWINGALLYAAPFGLNHEPHWPLIAGGLGLQWAPPPPRVWLGAWQSVLGPDPGQDPCSALPDGASTAL